MTVLVDSWCWIEYFNGRGEKIKEIIDSDETLFVSVINLAEVYRYSLQKKGEKEADQMISIMMSRCFIAPVEADTALDAVKINFEKKIGLGDSLILASAKAHKLSLMTGDPHFKDEKDIIYVGK